MSVGNGDINYGDNAKPARSAARERAISSWEVRGVLTDADKKRLQLQGLDPRARGAFFNGSRKDVTANYSAHVCYICGTWHPCVMERCTHACAVHVLPCCDPNILTKWTAAERKRWFAGLKGA